MACGGITGGDKHVLIHFTHFTRYTRYTREIKIWDKLQ
jgi:hypothetical protein